MDKPDIVERLRAGTAIPCGVENVYFGPPGIQEEAADEINRLRAEVECLWGLVDGLMFAITAFLGDAYVRPRVHASRADGVHTPYDRCDHGYMMGETCEKCIKAHFTMTLEALGVAGEDLETVLAGWAANAIEAALAQEPTP